MKILSLHAGVPQKVEWQGRSIQTSMRKSLVPSLTVHATKIDGDRFADPQHHGTPDSVFYVLGSETYTEINQRLGLLLDPGSLGENASLDSLDESQIEAGDTFRIGSVVVEATGPRVPCEKLNYVTQHVDAQMTFVKVNRPGVYFKIIETGEIKTGDALVPLKKSGSGLSIQEIHSVVCGLRLLKKCDDKKRLFEIIENPFLLPKLKAGLQKHATILKITAP